MSLLTSIRRAAGQIGHSRGGRRRRRGRRDSAPADSGSARRVLAAGASSAENAFDVGEARPANARTARRKHGRPDAPAVPRLFRTAPLSRVTSRCGPVGRSRGARRRNERAQRRAPTAPRARLTCGAARRPMSRLTSVRSARGPIGCAHGSKARFRFAAAAGASSVESEFDGGAARRAIARRKPGGVARCCSSRAYRPPASGDHAVGTARPRRGRLSHR
jgi:hypothetical protein